MSNVEKLAYELALVEKYRQLMTIHLNKASKLIAGNTSGVSTPKPPRKFLTPDLVSSVAERIVTSKTKKHANTIHDEVCTATVRSKK